MARKLFGGETYILRCMGTSSYRFYSIFTKGDNFHNFLFVFVPPPHKKTTTTKKKQKKHLNKFQDSLRNLKTLFLKLFGPGAGLIPSKIGSTLNGKNLLQGEQILSFSVNSHSEGRLQ